MKCDYCKNKVVFAITCSCKKNYCIKDRKPEDHKCTFDFKEKAKEMLTNQMPVVNSVKLQNKI